MTDLTIKQKKFCDLYMKTGNATQSYIKAGYKTTGNASRVEASKLLTKPNIQEYIAFQQEKVNKKNIMTLEQIQEFWSSVAQTQEELMPNRLKASELLVKTQGGFLDRLNVNAEVSLNFEDKLKEVQDASEF